MQVRELRDRDWEELREIRLRALHESGDSFLSNYDSESAYGQSDWIREFSRGHWWILQDDECGAAGLIGATVHEGRWYLEYLWIAPEQRGRGLAEELTRHAMRHLAANEEETVFLWVIQGNHAAQSLYEKMGFKEEGRQFVPGDPSRKEIRMARDTVQAKRQLLS